MRTLLVMLFLVFTIFAFTACVGTEEQLQQLVEDEVLMPMEETEPEVEETPTEPEIIEPEIIEPEIIEPAPQPPALPPSDLPETPTVNQIDIRHQINEVVRDFPPSVLMMEDDGDEYYDIQLYCVELYRIDTGINCFEPALYINDSDTIETRIPRNNADIKTDGERSVLYLPPYNETDMEEVHFFIADQRSAPDECYPYRYTFSIEETTATAREEC